MRYKHIFDIVCDKVPCNYTLVNHILDLGFDINKKNGVSTNIVLSLLYYCTLFVR